MIWDPWILVKDGDVYQSFLLEGLAGQFSKGQSVKSAVQFLLIITGKMNLFEP